MKPVSAGNAELESRAVEDYLPKPRVMKTHTHSIQLISSIHLSSYLLTFHIFSAHPGWARISYTQFVNMGQLGYTESFDPRYAIAYSQTGVVSNIKPSYMKGNSFYEGFSPQIGMFGAEGIKVQDNCMYRVVGGGELCSLCESCSLCL